MSGGRFILCVLATLLVPCVASSAWPVDQGLVVAAFRGPHQGIDIAAAAGAAVRAYAAGVVVASKVTKHCGQRIVLRHDDGASSIYCNLADVRVTPGETVPVGAPLGTIAVPAAGVRAHLHFELSIDGKKVDPLAHLPRAPA